MGPPFQAPHIKWARPACDVWCSLGTIYEREYLGSLPCTVSHRDSQPTLPPHKLLSVARGACGSAEVLRFYAGSW